MKSHGGAPELDELLLLPDELDGFPEDELLDALDDEDVVSPLGPAPPPPRPPFPPSPRSSVVP